MEKIGVSSRRGVLQGMASLGALAAFGGIATPVFARGKTAGQPNIKERTPMFAYVGSRTTRERNARGDGISVYRVEPATGRSRSCNS